MNKEQLPSILLWLRKNCAANGKSPIYIRVTLQGKRCEISTKLEVHPQNWDAYSQRVSGKGQESKSLNNDLANARTKILSIFQRLLIRDGFVSVETLRNDYLGIKDKQRMLLEIIRQHNQDFKLLIGKDYKKVTWIKYEAMYRLVTDFVKWKFNVSDIPLTHLNYEFITDFDFYLKTEKNIQTSTNPKYIKNLQKVIKECVAKEWLIKDPFVAFKLIVKKSKRTFLTYEELLRIEEKTFSTIRLDQVKDIFVFSCYTGLSYIDIFNLTQDNIIMGIDGEKWLVTDRQKTEVTSRIPLLPRAQTILDKYALSKSVIIKNKLLPVSSNQKTNEYLKEIAECCGIQKTLTFHMARHTFATTITLTNGVPIESVSKMLGHTKIETTQIYAKVLDAKVSHDMQLLKKVLLVNQSKNKLSKVS